MLKMIERALVIDPQGTCLALYKRLKLLQAQDKFFEDGLEAAKNKANENESKVFFEQRSKLATNASIIYHILHQELVRDCEQIQGLRYGEKQEIAIPITDDGITPGKAENNISNLRKSLLVWFTEEQIDDEDNETE